MWPVPPVAFCTWSSLIHYMHQWTPKTWWPDYDWCFWIPSVTISKIVIGYSTIDLKGPIRYVTLRACECFTIFFAWGFPNKKIGTFRRRLQVGICFCASMPEENTVKVLDFRAYGKYNYATHCGLIMSLLGTYTQWLRIFVVVKSIENLSGTRASIH